MSQKEIEQFEQDAERAISAMYSAQRPKQAYEDAAAAFRRAIDLAEKAGLKDQVARLTARRSELRAVYDSQFRGT
jgi:hypothetical protein